MDNNSSSSDSSSLGKELHQAIWALDLSRAKKLIAGGAPLDATDDRGDTPLQAATMTGRVEMVQLLVAEGADKDALDGKGETALHLAADRDHPAVVEALLDAGADASIRRNGGTALDLAAMQGHASVLDMLIRHGAAVNGADESGLGLTALHWAAAWNQVGSIDVLVQAGADTEAKDKYGDTPLHHCCCAAATNGLEAAGALLKHRAIIEARNTYEETPLHRAAKRAGKRGAVEMVELLLRWGADETVTNHWGKTPADVAGDGCYDIAVEQVGGVEQVRKLLAHAPVAREAWRRRGLLVAWRARPERVLLSASTGPRGEWMDLMGRVRGLDDGVFRTIVGYL